MRRFHGLRTTRRAWLLHGCKALGYFAIVLGLLYAGTGTVLLMVWWLLDQLVRVVLF